jgi:ABC-type transporter Mla MlaB component
MATKDDRPTLLSKMAMFVRNPTKDWSELDKPQQDEESGYDKQALKAMIERKRQNDFVRRREFDQLRKLRSRDATAVAALGRPSYFQSSMASDQDGRAVTLKKIDEIEAQMSKQWWKGKQEAVKPLTGAAPLAGKATGPANVDGAKESVSISLLSDHFATTRSPALTTAHPGGDSLSSQMRAGATPDGRRAAASSTGRAGLGVESYAASDVGFSASNLFALDVGQMATDPELEEAAIRFANGDYAGAEQGLLDALREQKVSSSVSLSWVAAVLDLYRATHDQRKFAQAVAEFSGILGSIAPQWAELGDLAPAMVTPTARVAAKPLMWESPAQLSAQAMEALRDALGANPMPWRLGWSNLAGVDANAMPLLAGLFGSLCDEPVSLDFAGQEKLVQVLHLITPSGDRGVDPAWWGLRMNVLRALHMPDAFELAALDYCVTYEAPPIPWKDAQCTFVGAEAVQASVAAPSSAQAAAVDGATQFVLRGELLGDVMQALPASLALGGQDSRVLVGCHDLVRVDFAAAGSLLNWAATRHAEGCQVQFRDVHRLVAAFFTVIGINEYAQVAPRPL